MLTPDIFTVTGSGPKLLLIPGSGLTRGTFATPIAALSQRFRCVSYDLRGMGKYRYDGRDYSLDAFVADAVYVLDQIGADRAHVLGYSLGGVVALELALRMPERVASLALVSTYDRADALIRIRCAMLTELLLAGSPSAFARASVLTAFAPGYVVANGEKVEAEIAARIARWQVADAAERQALVGHWRAVAAHDVTDRLGQIRCPTWVAVGAWDAVTPVEHAHRLASGIAGARLTVFPGAAHRLIDLPEFAAQTLDFLTSGAVAASFSAREVSRLMPAKE
jgi:pimeloyl-ACP methyl ester carboxylesterase